MTRLIALQLFPGRYGGSQGHAQTDGTTAFCKIVTAIPVTEDPDKKTKNPVKIGFPIIVIYEGA